MAEEKDGDSTIAAEKLKKDTVFNASPMLEIKELDRRMRKLMNVQNNFDGLEGKMIALLDFKEEMASKSFSEWMEEKEKLNRGDQISKKIKGVKDKIAVYGIKLSGALVDYFFLSSEDDSSTEALNSLVRCCNWLLQGNNERSFVIVKICEVLKEMQERWNIIKERIQRERKKNKVAVEIYLKEEFVLELFKEIICLEAICINKGLPSSETSSSLLLASLSSAEEDVENRKGNFGQMQAAVEDLKKSFILFELKEWSVYNTIISKINQEWKANEVYAPEDFAGLDDCLAVPPLSN